MTFKKRRWRKEPGTNTRRYKARDPSEVMRQLRPERRIVDEETWAAVRARSSMVRARYAGTRTSPTAPGNRTRYPLSGLLVCASCGAPMVITAGSSARYYYCGDFKKRGTCRNGLGVREDVVRPRIFDALRRALATPDAVHYLRKRIAERLGEAARTANHDLDERRARLARTKDRIAGLVRFIMDGDHSDYVRQALRDLEAAAKTEQAAIDALAAQATVTRLPTPDELLQRALDLSSVLAGDPVRAREALRRLFRDGRILLTPQADGVYRAEADLLPFVALAPEATKPPAEGRGLGRGTALGCAGRI